MNPTVPVERAVILILPASTTAESVGTGGMTGPRLMVNVGPAAQAEYRPSLPASEALA
jgi:hypothetical protein